MSEHEVPLDDVNEHIQSSALETREKWVSMVALSTAFLAAFAAVAALCSSHYESESMKEHSEAFDKWSYYQAKGIESLLLQSKNDMITALGKTPSPADIAKIDEYAKKRKAAEAEAHLLTKTSEQHGKAQENFALGVTMFQMSIAIGAISVLTKRRGFWYVSLLLGCVGLFFLAQGFIHVPRKSGEPSEEKAHLILERHRMISPLVTSPGTSSAWI